MRKKIKGIIITSAFAVLLAGCGSTSPSAQTSSAGQNDSQNSVNWITENMDYAAFLVLENEYIRNYEVLCFDKETGSLSQLITEAHISKESAFSESNVKETENEIANMGLSDCATVTFTEYEDLYCVEVVYTGLDNTEYADILYQHGLLAGAKTKTEDGGYDANSIASELLKEGYTQLNTSEVEELHFQ